MLTRRRLFHSALASLGSRAVPAAQGRKPNIVLFYVDDMGFGQPGCYGGKLAPTPHIDSLAANGVRFTDGYVAACVCSPSRVGLMTGRYQARTGHDANTTRPGTELDLGEVTMAEYLKQAGYVTGIVGKWHLGATEKHLPAARGFDSSVGAVSNLGEGRGPSFYDGLQLREQQPEAPVTSPFYARQALAFLEKYQTKPFFLYVPFNAVHAPHIAGERWMQRMSHIEGRAERAYAAQVAELDEAIGAILKGLRERKLEENTLIFLISDNGGAGAQADTGGLRGGKWNLFEGGIRVSYLVQWKGRIRGGRVLPNPVIQLDVLPTALAAAGFEGKWKNPIDGVNLLPLLEGKGNPSREALYWRFGVQYAVRRGDWKLVKPSAKEQPMLFDVRRDPKETTDLASKETRRAGELQALWDKWNAAMVPPRWEDRRWEGDEVRRNRNKGEKKNKKKA